jgi:Mrp family chromosome partitioning ATPase
MPQGPGFGALLLGAAQPGDVLKPTGLAGLWLMTAGEPDEGAVRELAREGAQRVFARREEFDFIILDSPPVLPVADSLLLAQFTDGVLFSLMRHVSRVPTTNAALKKMEALGVRILGAVVSGAHNELASYGPYY